MFALIRHECASYKRVQLAVKEFGSKNLENHVDIYATWPISGAKAEVYRCMGTLNETSGVRISAETLEKACLDWYGTNVRAAGEFSWQSRNLGPKI